MVYQFGGSSASGPTDFGRDPAKQVGLLQSLAEFSAQQAAQRPDVHQEAWAGGQPGLTIGRQAAARRAAIPGPRASGALRRFHHVAGAGVVWEGVPQAPL